MRITVDIAQQLLEEGQVVAIPTETVYGLGGLLRYPEAIDQIYSLKGRPSNNPLIIHVSSFSQITPFIDSIPRGSEALAAAFWPGPMTLVFPICQDLVPSKARAGLPTAAFRIPEHPVALDLLKRCGPIVMPSANLSGKPSATSPEHVETDFGFDFPVLDGGRCWKGVESTILLYRETRWEIIRLGALEPNLFENALGYVPSVAINKKEEEPLCPGQMYRHYAPQAKLILLKQIPQDLKGVILGFSDVSYPAECSVMTLGLLNSPEKVAENLYYALRQLDEQGIDVAYVDMNFPQEGLWLTIAERLFKAAQY